MPDFSLERACRAPVAGIDEAGRGPLAGPVVAAAVIVEGLALPASLMIGIDDSKKLPAAQRETLFLALYQCTHVHIGIGRADTEEIDRLNILGATLLAMRRAVEALGLRPAVALVDGNRPPRLKCKVRTVVKGDGQSLSIAAASIIAKVTRDRLMRDLANEHPQFGWERNKGYGTPEHLAALDRFGPCAHHRQSFMPMPLFAGRMGASKE